jgi:hypothetical protein
MTKSELRKARKAARAAGQPLTGELALSGGECSRTDPCEFSESARGYRARARWARRYDDLNGAPEGDWDR